MSEWRQFRILMRASFGRLMDTAVASRGIDATQFAIWIFALIATPLYVFAAGAGAPPLLHRLHDDRGGSSRRSCGRRSFRIDRIRK